MYAGISTGNSLFYRRFLSRAAAGRLPVALDSGAFFHMLHNILSTAGDARVGESSSGRVTELGSARHSVSLLYGLNTCRAPDRVIHSQHSRRPYGSAV